MYKRILLLVLLAVVERAGLGLPLAEAYVLANLADDKTEQDKIIWFAFVAGLVFDLVFLGKLGLSSLVLVAAALVIMGVRARFEAATVVVMVAVFGVSMALLSYIQFEVVRFGQLLLGVGLASALVVWFSRWGAESWDGQVFLKKRGGL